jgi:hypothetical protein
MALCLGMTHEAHYEQYEKDVAHRLVMDSMCAVCPVMKECWQSSRENKEEGLWGGVYMDGAGRAHQQYNNHKTKEQWQELQRIHGVRFKGAR